MPGAGAALKRPPIRLRGSCRGERRSHARPPADSAGPDRRVAAALRPGDAARRRPGGDRRDGDDRAEGPRLRGDRRRPGPERPVRGGRRRDRVRAVLHVTAHLDGAELVARGRRRWSGAVRGGRRRAGRRARRGDHARDRCAVPPARAAAHGLDRTVPLPRGRDGLPRGSRGRRRDRRAAEADRHVELRRQRLGGARLVAPHPRRDQLDDAAGGTAGAGADPRPALLRAARAGGARARGRGPPGHVVVRPRRARCRARRAGAARPARRRRCPGSTSSSSTTRPSSWPPPACC